jgi:(p)ppGpp synthase/HD superfamily hydrolase
MFMNDSSDILVATAGHFAIAAHSAVGQKRKYTGEPYAVHPMTVAYIVRKVGGTSEMVAAALLHDVLEDTEIEFDLLKSAFGEHIASIVQELTDEYTPKKYPELNRKTRKELEAHRYLIASNTAKTIKLADMIDNTMSIAEHDPGFMKTYGPEKRYLLEMLKGGNGTLWYEASDILESAGY